MRKKSFLCNSKITIQAYVIMKIEARSKFTMKLAFLDDAANSRDGTIPNFSKELKIEI